MKFVWVKYLKVIIVYVVFFLLFCIHIFNNVER